MQMRDCINQPIRREEEEQNGTKRCKKELGERNEKKET